MFGLSLIKRHTKRERYHTTTYEKVVQKNKLKSDRCHPTELSIMMEIFCISTAIMGTSQIVLIVY